MNPIFLDCEASSLSNESYPVEIAWSDETGKIESHLINPYSYPKSYTDWAPDSQAVHGLSRKYLSSNGEHRLDVATRVNKALAGETVYTDAPDFDKFWVERLFVSQELSFEFKHVDILLQDILPIEYWFLSQKNDLSRELHIDKLKKLARINCGLDAHRAANDVAYLQELYKLALRNGKNESK